LINPRLNPEYKKLCAILQTTQRRKGAQQRLHPEIQVVTIDGVTKMYLLVRNGNGLRMASTRCDLEGGLDEASRRVARKLTLDESLPRGMDGG
jgi:hypothetical protein